MRRGSSGLPEAALVTWRMAGAGRGGRGLWHGVELGSTAFYTWEGTWMHSHVAGLRCGPWAWLPGRAGGGGVSGCVRSHGQGEGSQGAGQGWYCHVPSIHAPELGPDDPWFPLCLGVTFPGSGQGRSIRAQGPAGSWEARLETGPMLAFQGWEADFSTGPRAMTVCPVQSGSA